MHAYRGMALVVMYIARQRKRKLDRPSRGPSKTRIKYSPSVGVVALTFSRATTNLRRPCTKTRTPLGTTMLPHR